MTRQFDFERLVELCRRTHEETRRSAARAINRKFRENIPLKSS